MKKILVSMMTIAMVSALIGGGIYAAFSDTETSPGTDAFTAGSIDLNVDADGVGYDPQWTDALIFQAMEPGDTKDLKFKNIGSLDGSLSLDATVGPTDADLDNSGSGDDEDANFEYRGRNIADTAGDVDYEMSGPEYSRLIYITLTGASWSTAPTDLNSDGDVSIYELFNATNSPAISLTAGSEVTITFTMGDTFEELASSNPMGDDDDWSDYVAGADDTNYEIMTGGQIWNVPQADGFTVTMQAVLTPV